MQHSTNLLSDAFEAGSGNCDADVLLREDLLGVAAPLLPSNRSSFLLQGPTGSLSPRPSSKRRRDASGSGSTATITAKKATPECEYESSVCVCRGDM